MSDREGQEVLERRAFAGFVVAIESPMGSIRRWRSEHTGESGQTLMRHDYGYIVGVQGADGDELDCYLGPNERARFAYVVHQLAPPAYSKFEEDKVFLGFDSEEAAREAFMVHRSDGDRAYGGMSAIPIEEFRRKLERRTGAGKVRHEVTMGKLRIEEEPRALTFKIEETGGGFVVKSEDGSKVLGRHRTRAEAEAQLRAVEAAKARRQESATHVAGRGQEQEEERNHPSASPDHSHQLDGVPGLFGDLVLLDVPRDAAGKVRAHVWDRGMTPGRKIKDGVETVFSVETWSQMLDNWKRRGEELALCWNHQSAYVPQNGQPAPALAYYNAIAIVMGGQVVRFEKLAIAGALEPPDIGMLQEQVMRLATDDNPRPSPDGCWFYRCEVTDGTAEYPLGQQLLPGFKYISPMFVPNGKDEQGRPIGYVLFDLAATNTAFQAGCMITFDQYRRYINAGARAPERKVTMATKLGKLAKFAKMDEGADDGKIKAGIFTRMEDDRKHAMEEEGYDYAGKASEYEEAAKAYEDAHMEDGDGDEHPHVIMRKLAKTFRRMAKMAAPEGANGEDTGQDRSSVSEKDKAGFSRKMEEENEAAKMQSLSAVAQRLGITVKPGMNSLQLMTAIEASAIPASQVPKLVGDLVNQRLDADRKERERKEFEIKAKQLMEAVPGYPAALKPQLLKLASDPSTFDMAVAAATPFMADDIKQDTSILFSRMTDVAGPVLAPPRRGSTGSGGRDQKVYRTSLATFVEDGGEFARIALEMAQEKGTPAAQKIDALLNDEERKNEGLRLYAANTVLKKERPDLWEASENAGMH